MNKTELEAILPHRNSMMLLDSADVLPDGSAHGVKTITGNEFFLDGHFPGNPIVPGVILCEILAQSACVLLGDSIHGPVRTVLTGLDGVRFKRAVQPGDLFETECVIEKQKAPFYWAKGYGRVNGELCVSASFSFAVFPEQEQK